MATALIDPFGRHIDYVRLSVTDRCDFRCVYCMAEDMTFLPRQAILSLEELGLVATAFAQLGVTKMRVTGGEPLIRKGVLSLFQHLGQLGLSDLSLTTNGAHLPEYAAALTAAGCTRVNISLDTLDPERFRAITRTGTLQRVLDGIATAQRAGFQRIKLNAVILRQRNLDDALPLTRFALERGLDIAFIEEMPLGQIQTHDRAAELVTGAELRERLAAEYQLHPSAAQTPGPARYYRVAGYEARVGFISPHSHNFCGTCNRVRVTVEGRLLLCLGNEHSVDLKPILRTHPSPLEPLKAAILAALHLKPERHHFERPDAPQIVRFMNATGG